MSNKSWHCKITHWSTGGQLLVVMGNQSFTLLRGENSHAVHPEDYDRDEMKDSCIWMAQQFKLAMKNVGAPDPEPDEIIKLY